MNKQSCGGTTYRLVAAFSDSAPGKGRQRWWPNVSCTSPSPGTECRNIPCFHIPRGRINYDLQYTPTFGHKLPHFLRFFLPDLRISGSIIHWLNTHVWTIVEHVPEPLPIRKFPSKTIVFLGDFYNVAPPVISWFISPSNYSYKYHKP